MKFLFLIFFLFNWNASLAQWSANDSSAFNKNQSYIFFDDIGSVKLMVNGVPTSNPVIALASSDAIQFQFDEINGNGIQYNFKLLHCNADWSRSELFENEYLSGFNNLPVPIIQNSMNTKVRYVHYSFTFPNVEMRPLVSGNYLMRVYINDDTDPAWQVRIYVVDQRVPISLKANRSRVSSKYTTHHQLDAEVTVAKLNIIEIEKQCLLKIMQNFREDKALLLKNPRVQIGEKLIYDNTQVLPAGNEFRDFDIRTIRVKARNIAKIEILPESNEVTVEPDKLRGNSSYSVLRDINGKYTIEFNETNMSATDAEYCHVHFSLELKAPLVDHRLYIVFEGNFYVPDTKYELKFNYAKERYEASVFLKQGFYNYLIKDISVRKNSDDTDFIEGNYQATENEYQAFFYYRPFSGRYDQLVGLGTTSSEW